MGNAKLNSLRQRIEAMGFLRLSFLSSILLWGAAAQASLAVNQAIIDLSGSQRTEDVIATNTGDKTLYVLAEAARIQNPGRADQERFTSPDPRQVGLLATPKKFVLKPGQSRVIRLQVLELAKTEDQVFRLLVKPVSQGYQGESSGLSIQIAYDILVMHRPAKAEPKISIKADGNQLVIQNSGNTNALLSEGKACRTQDDCTVISGKRMYVNASYAVPLDSSTQFVEFNYRANDETKLVRWNR